MGQKDRLRPALCQRLQHGPWCLHERPEKQSVKPPACGARHGQCLPLSQVQGSKQCVQCWRPTLPHSAWPQHVSKEAEVRPGDPRAPQPRSLYLPGTGEEQENPSQVNPHLSLIPPSRRNAIPFIWHEQTWDSSMRPVLTPGTDRQMDGQTDGRPQTHRAAQIRSDAMWHDAHGRCIHLEAPVEGPVSTLLDHLVASRCKA